MQPANILHLKELGSGWTDKDHVLLHACFQLLVDFVENEMLVNNYPDWEADNAIKNARKEIEALYNWWKNWPEKNKAGTFERDALNYEEENRMLKRLVDVGEYMWT